FTFPAPDLLPRLISSYFQLPHYLFPILHRPTFEADFAAGKHLKDEGFGAIVLLLCAIGARITDDPRVFLDHPDRPAHPHSAGWAWFRQVQVVRNTALVDPSVYDLQIIALSAQYMAGISPAQACWSMVGIGIRMAQDVGAHRKRMYQEQTVATELWKRAFWCRGPALMALDVWFSATLGRSCALSLNSIDVELPPDCDDEYWLEKDPAKAFKQPPGKPSDLSYFVCLVRLYLIYSHALRTIYSPRSHKDTAEFSHAEWSKRVVSELDSALTAWYESLPPHLIWNPAAENPIHFMQSSSLHSGYRLVQMTIHRPSIGGSGNPSSISLQSLAICTSAARACIHVQKEHQQRRPGLISAGPLASLLSCYTHVPTFVAAVVLLLRIWLAKRTEMRIDVEKEMDDIHAVVNFLALGETR
ncbi:fungal-specific transcription factor domain-containing protein, partial [Vararia minispora EC-137]